MESRGRRNCVRRDVFVVDVLTWDGVEPPDDVAGAARGMGRFRGVRESVAVRIRLRVDRGVRTSPHIERACCQKARSEYVGGRRTEELVERGRRAREDGRSRTR